MRNNRAAWINGPFQTLVVADAPTVEPGPGQIAVRNHAVAVNPIDRYKQKLGNMMYGWIKYPFVLGMDLAGVVEAVGPGVSRFAVGDRVVAHATGMEKARNRATESAFQSRTIVMAHMAAPIPDAMSFEDAAVLPLALSTAACGLFAPEHLGLALPTASPDRRDETVIVWGGSTSVGSNGIQLAVAAGYRVVTTASQHNFDYVKKLGAAEAFDYREPDVVDAMVSALQGHRVVGGLAIGDGSATALIRILGALKAKRKVAIATFPLDIDGLPDRPNLWTVMSRLLPGMLSGMAQLWFASRRRRVATSTIWGANLMHTDLGPAIYEEFLPEALDSGSYVAAPPPLVVGEGLEAIQAAFDRHERGVSAAKVVVRL